jgi:hypothetical protein
VALFLSDDGTVHDGYNQPAVKSIIYDAGIVIHHGRLRGTPPNVSMLIRAVLILVKTRRLGYSLDVHVLRTALAGLGCLSVGHRGRGERGCLVTWVTSQSVPRMISPTMEAGAGGIRYVISSSFSAWFVAHYC